MRETSLGDWTQKGTISWPRAAPKGLARLARAVAATRPRVVNHISEYRDGAQRTKAWANPVRIWPNMTTPRIPPDEECEPAKRIQLPTKMRAAEVMMESFGPRCST